jgi:hypothetical protein
MPSARRINVGAIFAPGAGVGRKGDPVYRWLTDSRRAGRLALFAVEFRTPEITVLRADWRVALDESADRAGISSQ